MKTKLSIVVGLLASFLGACASTSQPVYKSTRTADSATLVGPSKMNDVVVWVSQVDGARIRHDPTYSPQTKIYATPGSHEVLLYVSSRGKHAFHVLPMDLKSSRTYRFEAKGSGPDFEVTAWEDHHGSETEVLVSQFIVRSTPTFAATNSFVKQP